MTVRARSAGCSLNRGGRTQQRQQPLQLALIVGSQRAATATINCTSAAIRQRRQNASPLRQSKRQQPAASGAQCDATVCRLRRAAATHTQYATLEQTQAAHTLTAAAAVTAARQRDVAPAATEYVVGCSRSCRGVSAASSARRRCDCGRERRLTLSVKRARCERNSSRLRLQVEVSLSRRG